MKKNSKTEDIITCEKMLSMSKENGSINPNTSIVTKDEKIKFRCTNCGSCCTNVNIVLNPFDMYNISKALGISCRAFFTKYCTFYSSNNTGLPIVILESARNNPCTFLKPDISNYQFKCSLDDAVKPMVCRLTPFGAITRSNVSEDEVQKLYILHNECGANDTETSVAEYCRSYFMHEKEQTEAHNIYFLPGFIMDIVDYMHKLEDRISKGDDVSKEMNIAFYSHIVQICFDFDTSAGFMEQVVERKKNIIFFLVSFCSGYYAANPEYDFLKRLAEPVLKIFGSVDAFMKEYAEHCNVPGSFGNALITNSERDAVFDYVRTKF